MKDKNMPLLNVLRMSCYPDGRSCASVHVEKDMNVVARQWMA